MIDASGSEVEVTPTQNPSKKSSQVDAFTKRDGVVVFVTTSPPRRRLKIKEDQQPQAKRVKVSPDADAGTACTPKTPPLSAPATTLSNPVAPAAAAAVLSPHLSSSSTMPSPTPVLSNSLLSHPVPYTLAPQFTVAHPAAVGQYFGFHPSFPPRLSAFTSPVSPYQFAYPINVMPTATAASAATINPVGMDSLLALVGLERRHMIFKQPKEAQSGLEGK